MFGQRYFQFKNLRTNIGVNHLLKTILIAFAIFSTVFAGNSAIFGQTKSGNFRRSKLQKESVIKLNDFQVEKFADAVRIVWRTEFELKIAGFHVWRERNGFKSQVNENLIPASLLKTATGKAEFGDEYRIFDREGGATDCYWLEAVKGDGTSRWFGCYGVKTDPQNVSRQSEMSDLADSTESLKEKTAQKVKIETNEISGKRANNSLLSQTSDFLTNDNSALKIEVKQTGWYKIPSANLQNNGFNPQNSNNWKLYTDGVEQPIIVNADGSIEFYGQAIDTLYSGARIYWLSSANGANGKRIPKMTENYNASAVETWTRVVAEKRTRVLRAPGILNGERENWYSGLIYGSGLTQTINLSKIAAESGETATLYIDFQGIGTIVHQVRIFLNGIEVGQTSFNYTNRKEWSVTLPLSSFVEGENTILMTGSASNDYSFVESVRVGYPRRNIAENDSLEFRAAAGMPLKLKGFTSPAVRIFDLTDQLNISEYEAQTNLEADGTYSVSVAAGASARVMRAQGTLTPLLASNSITKNVASDLKNTANGANFLIVMPRKYFKVFWGLRALREQEGLITRLIDIGDIYDEFNNGMKSAKALKDFLQFAKQNWTIKPNYVMLVGDASVDPRNFSGQGGENVDLVPTIFTDTWDMECVSDEMLVDFNGDFIGEMVIGRLPVRNLDEMETAINKIVTIQPMTLDQINDRGVTLVSDTLNGYDFAAASRRIAEPIPASVSPFYIDKGSQSAATVRNQIISKLNSGSILVNYFGHGNVYNWTSQNILQNSDTAGLINIKRPSLMVMVACLNGAFAETNTDSLAEVFMRTPNGGAFATWSASGSNTADLQEFLARDFYQKLFSGMRIGEAARDAKASVYMSDIRKTYIFMGDPTQRLLIAP